MSQYKSLFGMKSDPENGNVIDASEHGRAGGVSTGQPFKYVSTIDATTGLPTSGGDGAILDGVSSAIKATVRDYTNSNPIAVALTDANGDFTSAGAGTQYTEDAVAAANPIGTAVNLIRQDTPGALVTTDGDNVAQRGTNYGAAYTQVVTSAGAFVDTFGGGTQYADGAVRGTATGTLALGDDGTNIQSIKVDAAGELQIDVLTLPAITGTVTANAGTNLNTSLLALEAGGNLAAIKAKTDNIPAQGQALAAASTPVVLTAAQITTLTPQTNALTDAQLRATAVPVSGTFFQATQPVSIATAPVLVAGTALIGKVGIDQVTANANEVVTKTGSVTAATLSAETTKVIGTVNQGTSPWVTSNATTSVVGNGAAATAQRVTIANDSTGILAGVTTVTTLTGITNALPVGANVIGKVSIDQATPGTTNLVQNKEMPDATSTFAPTNSTSTAYEASRIAKGSAGTLYSINGYNSHSSALFIQCHNTTTVPADTAVPIVIFTVPATSNFSYSADKFGRFFSTGITVCNSTTGPTKTISGATTWFDIQYS